MVRINIKGHEFEAITVKDAFNRRALQFQNNLINSLKRIDLTSNDVDFVPETNAMKKAPASVSWYFNNYHLHYSHNSRDKYVENLYVVYKVIDLKVTDLIEGRITLHEFINEFSEDMDIVKQRKEARITLGLDPNENDKAIIDKAYKDLAKKYHPDTGNGDMEKFKEINNAHKILKKEFI